MFSEMKVQVCQNKHLQVTLESRHTRMRGGLRVRVPTYRLFAGAFHAGLQAVLFNTLTFLNFFTAVGIPNTYFSLL